MGLNIMRYWPSNSRSPFRRGFMAAAFPWDHWRENLKDLGPAIGGCWALSAGLLAYYAALSGIRMQQEQRMREVAAVCLAEIEAIWDRLNEMDVIETLRTSSQKLREDSVN